MDSDLVDFLSGSTDSAIDFSGSADLQTPIRPLLEALKVEKSLRKNPELIVGKIFKLSVWQNPIS